MDKLEQAVNLNNLQDQYDLEGNDKILIVDDLLPNRFLLRGVLTPEGYEIFEAENGKEALEQVKVIKPDIILLDIVMPVTDGFEVCRVLKKDPNYKAIPIIFITSLGKSSDIVKGFDCGAADYITKPFNPEEIKVRIKTHLRLKSTTLQLKRYNEELEKIVAEESKELIKAERQAAFGQLIQGIVHNMNSPLTVVKGACQLALTELEESCEKTTSNSVNLEALKKSLDTVKGDLDLIHNAADRLNQMISGMMIRSSSDQHLKREIIDLNSIITNELSFLQLDIQFKHKFQKKINLLPEPLLIEVIEAEIAHAFTNIIRNAIDVLYEHESPAIIVETRKSGAYAIFTVSDNGPGIAQENQEKIFDPFFTTKPRADSDKVKEGPTGTGLGLYMCHRTVKNAGGEIFIDSKEGKATTFITKIPLARKYSA